MKKTFFVVLLFLSYLSLFSQSKITGKVIDAHTKEPLAFANISINNNPKLGTFTDIDGNFSLQSEEIITQLTCNYVGYKTITVEILSKNQQIIVVEIEPTVDTLKEVIIQSKENPAWAIIRKVQQNENINNPEHLLSYSYKSYNKVIYDMEVSPTYSKDTTKIIKKLKGGHLIITESITEKKYIKPNIVNEKVIATQTSGFKQAEFPLLPEDVQPLSFYKNELKIIENQYLNPISKGSFDKYKFRLEQTFIQNQDTIYIISFSTKPNKNINGLKGILHINAQGYAIQNVIASPDKIGVFDFKIQQQYKKIDGNWFPYQLNFSIKQSGYVDNKFRIKMDGKSYIDNVQINPQLEKKEFVPYTVVIDKEATKRDSVYWQINRIVPLNTTEKITYKTMDSIGVKRKWDTMLTLAEKLAQNKIPFKVFDIHLNSIFNYNEYEKIRLGLGFETNEKLFKQININALLAFGTQDKAWKYGVGIAYKPSESDFYCGANYKHDLVEVGNHNRIFKPNNFYNFFDYVGSKYDQQQLKNIYFGYNALRNTALRLDFSQAKNQALYNFEKNIAQFYNTTIQFNIRYAYGEKRVKTNAYKTSYGSNFPILNVSYTKGLQNVLGGEFSYNKIETGIEHTFSIKNFGKTTYNFVAGYIDNALPYSLLFTGEGNYTTLWGWQSDTSFQTMLPYEFLSDKYANLFFKHNFQGLLLKIGKFQPEISLLHNMSWGTLNNRELYSLYNIKTKEKTFFESGISFENMMKFNYLKLVKIGFGLGSYYRWGYYANENLKNNLALKINVSISTQ